MFTLRNSVARATGDTPSKATDVGVGLSVNVIDFEALQIVRAVGMVQWLLTAVE